MSKGRNRRARHRAMERLVERYFGTGGLAAEELTTLLAHLSECSSCRALYDRLAVVRRLATGGPADDPTARESAALFERTMAELEPPPLTQTADARVWLWLERMTGLAAAALLAALFVVPFFSDPVPRQQEHVGVRGAGTELPAVGLGMSGIDPAGEEYEVVEGVGACRADALRFYVTTRVPEVGFYFVVGLQEGSEPHWYAPGPEEASSYAFEADGRVAAMVPWEIELAHSHRPGRLVVIGLFSAVPLARERVAEVLMGGLSGRLMEGPERAARELAEVLGEGVLAAQVETRIIECEESP